MVRYCIVQKLKTYVWWLKRTQQLHRLDTINDHLYLLNLLQQARQNLVVSLVVSHESHLFYV
jgi:hypothetical protein